MKCYDKLAVEWMAIVELINAAIMFGAIMIEFRVLQYFLTVAREGGITKGAQALHITQPTLSRQLAQLEEEIGVKLFRRTSRRLVLTEEGILLRRRAEEIMALVDKTEEELLKQDEMLEGSVAVGSSGICATKILSAIIADFQEKYPQVKFDFIFGDAEQAKEGLDMGTLDLALLLEPVDIQKYEFIRIEKCERWAAILPKDSDLARKDGITPEDLLTQKLIVPPRLALQGDIAAWFGVPLSGLNIKITSNMSVNGALLVEQSLGCALTIEGALPFLDENKVVMRRLVPELIASSVLAWKKDTPFSRAVRSFISFAQKYLRNNNFSDDFENLSHAEKA